MTTRTEEDLHAALSLLEDRADSYGTPGFLDAIYTSSTPRALRRPVLAAALGSAAAVSAAVIVAMTTVGGDGSGGTAQPGFGPPPSVPPTCTFSFSNATKPGALIPPTQRCAPSDAIVATFVRPPGTVLVAAFWAAWCGPCRTELPQYDRLYRQEHERGIDFVGIDTKDERATGEEAVRRWKISFPIVSDPDGAIGPALGGLPIQALPLTVLFDRQGRVAAIYAGAQSSSDLAPALQQLTTEH